jgi:hypothetical protein
MAISFSKYERDSLRPRRKARWAGDEPAATDNYIGLTLSEDPSGTRERRRSQTCCPQSLERVSAVNASQVEQINFVAGSRDKLGLETAARTHEKHLCSSISKLVCDRHGRDHVSRRTARRHDYRGHLSPSFWSVDLCLRPRQASVWHPDPVFAVAVP